MSSHSCQYIHPSQYNLSRVRVGGGIGPTLTANKSTQYKLTRWTTLARRYRLTMMPRLGSWPILGSMTCTTRPTRLRRMVILTRPHRLIRCYDRGQATPNPNPIPIPNIGQIILTRLTKLDSMTRVPKLTRPTRLPRKTTITRMRRMARIHRLAILTRLTRLT